MTLGRLPVIDRAPDAGNVFIAAGHNAGAFEGHCDWKAGRGVGGGAKPHIDPAMDDLARFS
jgi:hypothetical protein